VRSDQRKNDSSRISPGTPGIPGRPEGSRIRHIDQERNEQQQRKKQQERGEQQRRYVEAALREGIPSEMILLKCRNWGVTATRAAAIAEEASAEAYLRALEQSFDSETHYRAWVSRTALNFAVDLLRRGSRTRPLGTTDLAAPSTRAPVNTATLSECLEKLDEEQQQILRMTYEEGLTLDEIALRLLPSEGGSANARRLRIKRKRDVALRQLRRYLESCGFESDDSVPGESLSL
jgi:RNA polymerase sigma factor (sigma-70 family)